MATKKDDDAIPTDLAAILAENERLRAETAANAARQAQMLDMMADMQASIDAMQTTAAAIAPDLADGDARQAALDAELAALSEEFKDYPAIEVFQRRALVGVEAAQEIRLFNEPSVMDDPTGEMRYWQLRWFNLSKEGRAAQADAEGYIKVLWSELRSEESLAALERKDQYVRRGERGLEVLYKIPKKLHEYKKRRDADRSRGLLTSESRLRDHLSNAVAGMAGNSGDNADQAGSFVHDRKFGLTITPGERERVTL